jgi:phosphatidylglycerophosphate synthase
MTRAALGRPAAPAVLLLARTGLPQGTAEVIGSRAVAESGQLIGVVPPGRLRTALLEAPEEREVVLIDSGWLTAPTVYGDLVSDPRPGVTILVDADDVPVGVRLPAGVALALADALPAGTGLDALVEHLRSAGPHREIRPGSFPSARVGEDLSAALSAVDSVDEAALRLRRASRSDDGFLSWFLIRPLSRQLTRRAVGTRLTPAQITAASLVLGLGSGAAYAGGTRAWLSVGSFLLLCSLVVDCVDGEVARYTRTFSALGGWLDVGSDRVKEYAVYAGLAVGAAVGTHRDLWGLVLAAFGVLVVRHAVDFGFAASAQARPDGSAVERLSAATSRASGLMWAKRALILPVGERTIVLIILVPLLGAAAALWVLFGWGLVAGAYTTVGRLGRSWLVTGAPPGTEVSDRLAAQCDSSPVPAALLGTTRRWGWLVPAACRALEAGAIVALCWRAGGRELLAGAFAVLSASAFRDYDVVYRQRLGGARFPGDALAWVGWPVRVAAVALVGLAVVAGWSPGDGRWALLGLAAGWGSAALAASVWWWRQLPPGATAP